MDNLLIELERKHLSVHIIDLEYRAEVLTAYCRYEKDPVLKCSVLTPHATHYIMHDSDVVFFGQLYGIEAFVRRFNEKVS